LMSLVSRSCALEMPAQPLSVMNPRNASANVDYQIVPSGDDSAVLLLGRIPARRYVVIRPLKDCKNIALVLELLPDRVRSSNVSLEHTRRLRRLLRHKQ